MISSIDMSKSKKFHTCLICNKTVNRIVRHVNGIHKIDHRDYLIKYVYNGVTPLCGCGCGQEAPYNMIHSSGFKNFIHSHKSDYLKQHPKIVKKMTEPWIKSSRNEESNKKRSLTLIAHHKDNPSHAQSVSQAMTGRIVTDETRKRMSETRKREIASGNIVINANEISKSITKLYIDGGPSYATGEFISIKCEHVVNYRSSFELQFLELIEQDESVKKFKYEWMSITYMISERQHRYIPDFLITLQDDSVHFVEVKPRQMRDFGINIEKRVAALEECRKNKWNYSEWSIDEQLPWKI